MSDRIKWIDIAKGIGIILVIVGHGIQEYNLKLSEINTIIYLFHLPLFFILSGCVFALKENSNLKLTYVIKKIIKQLSIPYVIFCLVIFVLHFLEFIVFKENGFFERLFTLNGMINTILITQKSLFSNLWFLPCMLLVKIIVELYEKYFPYKTLKKFLIVISGMCMLYIGDRIAFPMYFNTALVGIIFFYIGIFVFNKKEWRFDKIIFLVVFWICITIYLVAFKECICSFYNLKIEIPKILFFVGAITGSQLVIFISKIFSNNKILEYIGRESIYFYGIHFIAQNIISLFIKTLKIDFINDYIMLIITTIINVILCMVWVECIRRVKRRKNEKEYKSKLHI